MEFIRPFLSSDLNDTNLTASQTDFAWSFGYIFENDAQLPLPSNEGATILDLSLPLIPPSGAQNETTNETIVPPPPSGQFPSSSAVNSIVSVLTCVGFVLQVIL